MAYGHVTRIKSGFRLPSAAWMEQFGVLRYNTERNYRRWLYCGLNTKQGTAMLFLIFRGSALTTPNYMIQYALFISEFVVY